MDALITASLNKHLFEVWQEVYEGAVFTGDIDQSIKLLMRFCVFIFLESCSYIILRLGWGILTKIDEALTYKHESNVRCVC